MCKVNNNFVGDLRKEQYKQFLKHFTLESETTQRDTPLTANMAGKSNRDDEWIVDSRCT